MYKLNSHKLPFQPTFSIYQAASYPDDFSWRILRFLFGCLPPSLRAPGVALVVKNPPANAGDVTDEGSIPGSGRSPGGGHGNPLQYSCLENSMDRGAWKATVHT